MNSIPGAINGIIENLPFIAGSISIAYLKGAGIIGNYIMINLVPVRDGICVGANMCKKGIRTIMDIIITDYAIISILF